MKYPQIDQIFYLYQIKFFASFFYCDKRGKQMNLSENIALYLYTCFQMMKKNIQYETLKIICIVRSDNIIIVV